MFFYEKIFVDIEKDHLLDSTPAIELPKVKFGNLNNITIFVPGNMSGSDVTSLKSLILIGQPNGEKTKMDEFKRVSGKAGESH